MTVRPTASPPPPLVPQRKLVGVATADFGLFADVVATLKQAHIKFVSFDPQQRAPGNVGLIITSVAEAREGLVPAEAREPTGLQATELSTGPTADQTRDPTADQTAGQSLNSEARWKGRRYLALDWEPLPPAAQKLELALLPFKARWALAGYPLLRVGVDPGPRPGIAILAPEGLLVEYQAHDEERALAYLLGVLRAAGPGQLLLRVGHGAPLPRNRLINGLMGAAMALWGSTSEDGPGYPEDHDEPELGDDMWVPAGPTPWRSLPPGLSIEVVDESGSSSRPRVSSNTQAAALIATLPGFRLRKPLRSHVKPADIAKVQEHSRRRTRGQRTLSASLAEAVAAGQMSLEEALQMEGS